MTVPFGLKIASASVLLLAMMLNPSQARAQDPPAGAIFDLSTALPVNTVLNTDTLFTTSFVGDGNTEYVSFAFREQPAYFSFDDSSVTAAGSSVNLLLNPGFEQGATGGPPDVGSNFPDNWGRWIQPVDTSAIGEVASNTAPYGCGNELAHSGTQFWCDGSVQGYDGIYQGFATTAGVTYNISFWLDDNSGSSITNPSIDMLVYAGDQIPVGTIPIGSPEPASLVLMGAGIVVLGIVSRRRRRAA